MTSGSRNSCKARSSVEEKALREQTSSFHAKIQPPFFCTTVQSMTNLIDTIRSPTNLVRQSWTYDILISPGGDNFKLIQTSPRNNTTLEESFGIRWTRTRWISHHRFPKFNRNYFASSSHSITSHFLKLTQTNENDLRHCFSPSCGRSSWWRCWGMQTLRGVLPSPLSLSR